MSFVLIAAILTAVTVAMLVLPLTGTRRRARSRAAADAALYKAQLAEIGRDVARGTVVEAEAAGARVEISRRLLATARRAEQGGSIEPAPAPLSRSLAVAGGLAIPVLAAAVYLTTGAPGLPDLPYAGRDGERALAAEMQRPSQETAERLYAEELAATPAAEPSPQEIEYRDLVARLEQILVERPQDVRGHELLAQAYLRLGRNAEGWRAQRDLIRLKGMEATPDDFALQVEGMVLAAGGYLSQEAEEVLKNLLRLDANHPAGRYYAGIALAQQGRMAEAIAVWEALRAELPDDAPEAAQLDGMLAVARERLGATGGPGPDAAAIGAAAEMTPEERQAMIESMVARLGDRLASEGGTPAEWLRLMRALRQLGRTGEAEAAYAAAAAAHAGDDGALALLREGAAALGLAGE